jgi:hypothetical protein
MDDHQASRGNGSNGGSELQDFAPERGMLLVPHCLRPTQGCPGKMTSQGLDCSGCTREDCRIHPIREAAIRAGYLDVCVAPGGRLAVRRVAEVRPGAIVAVACDKELEEGVAAVRALRWEAAAPPIIQIPLSRDGCVDTDVDMDAVLAVIES